MSEVTAQVVKIKITSKANLYITDVVKIKIILNVYSLFWDINSTCFMVQDTVKKGRVCFITDIQEIKVDLFTWLLF